MFTTRTPLHALALGVAVAAALTLTSCAGSAAPTPTAPAAGGSTADMPAEMTTVKVGITGATAPPTFLALIAQEMGIAKKNNISIEFTMIAPNVTAQTLSQGAVDILASPAVEQATVLGAPFKIIAGSALSYWHVVAKNDVANWSDLEGKTVGLPCGVGATCDAFIDEVLKAHDVDASSITFINGTAQGTYDALAAGSVDAALTTAPYTYALGDSGKTHEFDITDVEPYLSTEFTAKESYVTANPAVVAGFVKSMSESAKMLAADPVDPKVLEAIDRFEEQNGIDPATLDQKRFLAEFAKNKSWQIVPTKALISRNLDLLAAANPEASAQAKAATFDDMVAQIPLFEGQYE